MKILIVEYRDIHHPEAGGAELVLFKIFGSFAQQGHRIDYLCSSYEGAADCEEVSGINVIRRGNQLFFNFLVPKVYAKELKKNKYNLIVEGIDKLPFFLPLFEKDVPILSIVPHLFGKAIFEETSWLIGAYVYLYELLVPSVYRNAFFSVPAGSTKDDLVRRGLRAEKIRVIRNGMDHDLHEAPVKNPVSDHPIILYLGRAKKYKGIDIGMKAVSLLSERYPDVEYQIVGSGDYLEALRHLAVKLNLRENVSFLGYVSNERKVELLQRASVLVYPSPKEGWGLSVIEANACGTPAVASNSPGLCESVVDGKTGFLVKHKDVRALADRIDLLLSDKNLYNSMRENAIEWARRFTWERQVKETNRFILDILRSTNLPGG